MFLVINTIVRGSIINTIVRGLMTFTSQTTVADDIVIRNT